MFFYENLPGSTPYATRLFGSEFRTNVGDVTLIYPLKRTSEKTPFFKNAGNSNNQILTLQTIEKKMFSDVFI